MSREESATPDAAVADDAAAPSGPAPNGEAATEVRGHCDGIRGDDLYGWAQDLANPDRPVWVEISLDGVLVGEELASIARPDLRAAAVGHGRYGWRFTLPTDLPTDVPVQVLVRSRGGPPLAGGDFTLNLDGSLDPADQQRCDEFVAMALGEREGKLAALPPPPPPAVHFLLYSPVALAAANFGVPEYSYAFVRQAFASLLEELGTVHDAPDVETADRLFAEIEARGESAILLSFAPPQRTLTGTRCPVVPVVAWEYPTIPAKAIGGDVRHDWRLMLRQAGRAITLSRFAADAIRATMGSTFPVAAIPTPVWDRYAPLHKPGARRAGTTVQVQGFVYDTWGRSYEAGGQIDPVPDPDKFADYGDTLHIDGTVFTSIFSPHDSRKDWGPMLIAFLAAHRDREEATLVLKMISSDPAFWWWSFHDILNSMAGFACRVVVLHGYLDDNQFDRLICASHWIVNSSNAEGLCMPLIEYMSAGTPAIAPAHTAMTDYITPENALVVGSSEEVYGFPQEPEMEFGTTRHRVAWDSLVAAFDNGYRIARDRPEDYARRCAAAHETMRGFCSEAVVAAQLDEFLGLNIAPENPQRGPSALLKKVAAS